MRLHSVSITKSNYLVPTSSVVSKYTILDTAGPVIMFFLVQPFFLESNQMLSFVFLSRKQPLSDIPTNLQSVNFLSSPFTTLLPTLSTCALNPTICFSFQIIGKDCHRLTLLELLNMSSKSLLLLLPTLGILSLLRG